MSIIDMLKNLGDKEKNTLVATATDHMAAVSNLGLIQTATPDYAQMQQAMLDQTNHPSHVHQFPRGILPMHPTPPIPVEPPEGLTKAIGEALNKVSEQKQSITTLEVQNKILLRRIQGLEEQVAELFSLVTKMVGDTPDANQDLVQRTARIVSVVSGGSAGGPRDPAGNPLRGTVGSGTGPDDPGSGDNF